MALLRSPHVRVRSTPKEISALDRALSDAGYLGEYDALVRLLDGWRGAGPSREAVATGHRAGEALEQCARELLPLRVAAPPAEHLTRLLEFLTSHEELPAPDDPLRARQLRAR